ncbi:MAG: MlaC/ttg2D family ABC transporter substrate-binding protein [Burkholderiales bacterium]|nr:ABC transporter substrate-binding protein [Burkholderiales bacterium]MDQ3195709.1 ABC transporter substrate-binding protein [Pseudomonadota bacterium]
MEIASKLWLPFIGLFISLAASGLFGVPVLAAEDSPDQMIRSTTKEVLAIVQKDRDIQAGDKQKIIELVEARVLPNFNFNRMTALAVGRGWRDATPQQRENLVKQFRTLLVRTYSDALNVSSALEAARGDPLEVKPLTLKPGATQAVVQSVFTTPDGVPIPIDYRVEKGGDGWKVYDVIVEGISLVTNYRSTFSDEINRSGVDGLIKLLADKNGKLKADPQRSSQRPQG